MTTQREREMSASTYTGSVPVFSERSLIAVARPFVCRLSVYNARAPYSGGSNFRQYFYSIWYPGHPLTSRKNFTEIVLGQPLRRGRGVAKYTVLDLSKAISRKRCKIEGNRKSMTLNDLERRNGPYLRYFTEFLYIVVVKQLLGLLRFQNLLLIYSL